jgi:uncharacterized protein YlzI (FlbEa/FlbD family)
MIYLTKINVSKNYTNGDFVEILDKLHIVEADSEQDVVDKIQRHYDLRDIEDFVSHYVVVSEIEEIIQ